MERETNEVTLYQMLEAREERVALQKKLLQEQPGALISFMLNIPGPIKTGEAYEQVFEEGLEKIETTLSRNHMPVLVRMYRTKVTGYEGYLTVDAEALRVKEQMILLEEETAIARMYDIDVLRKDGTKVSREETGREPRKCLLCDRPAYVCSRSRTHTISEMTKRIDELIREEQLIQKTEEIIRTSLMEEVFTTPKPGLVDRQDQGAHTDMDCALFQRSTDAIAPDLARMFSEGYHWTQDPETLFAKIRETGKKTEEKMFAATDGVNTHKGMIFTIGILSAASGYLLSHTGNIQAEEVCACAEKMTKRTLAGECLQMKKRNPITHGEKMYAIYRETGVRGMAMEGYPVLAGHTVPHMRRLIRECMDRNQRNLQILLELMSCITDTNVLTRSGQEGQQWIREQAGEILHRYQNDVTGMYRELARMNRICIDRNISPGGAADLLAATIFLIRMENLEIE